MRNLMLAGLLLLLPFPASAAEQGRNGPRWSLEVKGGTFSPDIDDWKTYYGKDHTGRIAFSLAYKFLPNFEAGVEGGRIRDRGQGFAQVHNEAAGTVKYELYPLQVFILFRGAFLKDQWVVPYAGGGWSRLYYREEISKQSVARGYADGSHYRAGIQVPLDDLDPRASAALMSDYGIYSVSFFIEAQSIQANTVAVDGSTVDLGGTSWLGGLLFEF